MSRARLALLGALSFVTACGAPGIAPEAHGVSVEAGPCGRGVVVVESDYQSSNVSLLDFDGNVLSESLLSSSSEASGFAMSLGGDAVPPGSAQSGSRVVLIDRYPAGVLKFVDLASGQISVELAVGTGFRANPQDYLELGPEQALVSRYERNPNPGRQIWDGGGDVLLLDPSRPAITGRIDLAPAMQGEPARYSAHPARLTQVRGRVFVLLAAYANDYTQGGTTSRLVELDPHTGTLLSTLLLEGLRGCSTLAVAPDQGELAIACTGDDLASSPPNLSGSGLAIVDVSGAARLSKRFRAQDLAGDAVGFGLAYPADGVLLFSTLGYRQPSGAVGSLDALLWLDIASGQAERVLSAESEPFTLGSVRCASTCGACFATDAQRAGGSVLRFAVGSEGRLEPPRVRRVETRIGLPPRYLSGF